MSTQVAARIAADATLQGREGDLVVEAEGGSIRLR